MEEQLRPKIGIGLFIMKDGKVLLQKRKNAHGDGEYCGPGGHLEYMESIEECARRETREETGIEIKNIRFLALSNLKRYAPRHYVNIGLVADWKSGEPTIKEPEKTESWNWYELDQLPSPLFECIPYYLEAYKQGRTFFDA